MGMCFGNGCSDFRITMQCVHGPSENVVPVSGHLILREVYCMFFVDYTLLDHRFHLPVRAANVKEAFKTLLHTFVRRSQ